ncbi:MAG: radical SAM protein, partial [Candidatus Electrothrix sp. ATG1]|nr:radical SAM protein [Candidatus Electrothrix sp. ATG1]
MHPLLTTETGTVRKKWKGRLPVALLYPNTYPLAVSNLGFQLLYRLLNASEDLVCERFVYPQNREAFRSLESTRPLADFPLVFGSISFEHDYTRLTAMLAAGGVAPYAADRPKEIASGSPLVVLGGVA